MSARRGIHVEGLGHGDNPTPTASRIGNIVYTGGISGIAVPTQSMPQSVPEQCANMFANLRRVLAASGATPEDVIMLTIHAKDRGSRDAINQEWLAMFPDPSSRPARHFVVNDGLAGGMAVQCLAVVVIA